MKPHEISNKFQRAAALHHQGRLSQAKRLYQEILIKVPNHFDSQNLLGLIEYQQKNYAEAVRLIGRALQIDATFAPAHLNIANAFLALKRYEEALSSYDRALTIRPHYFDAFYNRGNALLEMKRYDDALVSYDMALTINPDNSEVNYNRAHALTGLKNYEAALAGFDRTLILMPGDPDALCNRGNVLFKLRRLEEALLSYESALRVRLSTETLYNRGQVLLELGRLEDALASYDRALAIDHANAEALYNRGQVLIELKRFSEAAEAFARLQKVYPDHKYLKGEILRIKLNICDWENHDSHINEVTNETISGKKSVVPFTFLSISGDLNAQLKCAQTYAEDRHVALTPAIWRNKRYSHDRIRIAYLSADFHDHATSYLMAGLFEAHDKSRFEITAISFGPDVQEEMRSRMRVAFNRFIEARRYDDHKIAQLLQELEIDIAVDLKGYTHDCRPEILAMRPAPVQVNYLGYPGTMGAAHIDYIIADRFVISRHEHSCYTENVVCLPHTYQPNDFKRRLADKTPTREEVGLPEVGFVFCSFNNNWKITPSIFDVWMRLLNKIEGSVLWLLEDNAAAVRNLRREAAARGVQSGRLIFAQRTNLADHLARHRLAGLMLDTLPYNAHTTASDALWAGLPIVTCRGSSFAGRVASSLLVAIGLPELITGTLDDYEALALKLARDGSMLAAVGEKLARNRMTSPLFDTDRYRRHIESAYQTMWERYQRGEPPESFAVAPD